MLRFGQEIEYASWEVEVAEALGAQRGSRGALKLWLCALGVVFPGAGRAETAAAPAASESANPLAVTSPESNAQIVHYQLAGTLALLTLEAKAKNGAKSLVYSNPIPGFAVAASVVHDVWGRSATIGGSVHSQSLTFDESLDGFLPPSEIRSNDVILFSLFPWTSEVRVGPLLGSTGEPMLLPKDARTVEILTVQTPFVGGRLDYTKSLSTEWELGAQADARLLLPTKAAGVSVETGLSVALEASAGYRLSSGSTLSFSYALTQELQNTANYQSKRGEDTFALAFASSFTP